MQYLQLQNFRSSESSALSSPSHAPLVLCDSPAALSQMHMLCVSLDFPGYSLARSLFLSPLNALLAFRGVVLFSGLFILASGREFPGTETAPSLGIEGFPYK